MSGLRILFVDDEPAVLESLRDLLRRQQREWQMVFANSGQAALDELTRAPFDVVVTDMRMPGMDGVELLTRVKELHPETIRLILTGFADRKAVMRSLPVAHQLLGKPCDPDTLRVSLKRILELHRFARTATVLRLVGRLERLPSTPSLFAELNHVAMDPSSGLADLAKIVERDPAMSTKVLQLVNSAYFGSLQPITSIRRGVSQLGVEVLKGLALTTHAFDTVQLPAGLSPAMVDRMQHRSLQVALLARSFLDDPVHSDEAFCAGLLADVGKLVIALSEPQLLPTISLRQLESGLPMERIEQELIGATHAELGAYLVGVWGLPVPIAETVAFHHHPERVTEGARDVLAAVHAADVLFTRAIDGEKSSELNLEFLDQTGHTGHLADWTAKARAAAASS